MAQNLRVAAVIVKNGRILLVKRIKKGQTYYVLPGGHLEGDENNEEALIRELAEETTLNVKVEKLLYTLENPETKSKELYFLCSTDDELAELDKASKEYQETMQGKNIYVPMWVGIDLVSQLNLYPIDIRNLIIKQSFPSRYYKNADEKYINPPGKSISKPQQAKIASKTFEDIKNILGTVSRYLFGFLALLNFSMTIISYFGEIRIEPPVTIAYSNDGSLINNSKGGGWPTIIYITKGGSVIEIFPKSLTFDSGQNVYFYETQSLWESHKTGDIENRLTYKGGFDKWLPVGFFAMLTSLFLYFTFRPRSAPKRMADD